MHTRAAFLLERIKHATGLRRKPTLYFFVPNVNWVLDWVAHYVTREVSKFGLKAHKTTETSRMIGEIIHFGSLWETQASLRSNLSKWNHIVGTIFHGMIEEPEFKQALEAVLANSERFEKIHTASRIMEDRLIRWGVPREKLAMIPLGIDLERFVSSGVEEKLAQREKLGIPADAFCLGSFHKDGVGMGEGREPKLIKGPDVFLKVIEQVHKSHPVFVLLSAPARGYVKAGLEKLGIPYKHLVLEDFWEIPHLYKAIDLYLMTSREEGGPKGVLEALATGTPLVATRVGLAPDVVTSGEDGLLADSEDVETLAANVVRLIEDADLRESLASRGLETIKAYDWPIIAKRYFDEIYNPILERLGY